MANYILFTNVTSKDGTSVLMSLYSGFIGYYWEKLNATQLQLMANSNSLLIIEFSVADASFSLHNWLIGQLIQALDYSDSQTYVLPQLPAVGGTQAYIFNIT